jgi:23S rRNA (pseudouridine1915-N3)-methyltransferase
LKLVIIAVGTRMPGWVDAAMADYAKRMGRELLLEIIEVKPQDRAGGVPAARAMALEAERIRTAIPKQARVVALDERGADVTTRALAQRLEGWMGEGRDVAIIIGGPDGLDAEVKSKAQETLRLSSLTLPHALVRVLLAEQLYRAASLLKNHPYHRE